MTAIETDDLVINVRDGNLLAYGEVAKVIEISNRHAHVYALETGRYFNVRLSSLIAVNDLDRIHDYVFEGDDELDRIHDYVFEGDDE